MPYPGFKNILVDIAGNQCTTVRRDEPSAERRRHPVHHHLRHQGHGDEGRREGGQRVRGEVPRAVRQGHRLDPPYPGVQGGGTNVNGQHWDEDIPYNECNMMNVLLPAIKAAGKDLTWDKVYANMMKTDVGPDGATCPSARAASPRTSPTWLPQVHVETLNPVAATTPLDANGKTYGGCPLPINCFVPQPINGQEWFPASKP